MAPAGVHRSLNIKTPFWAKPNLPSLILHPRPPIAFQARHLCSQHTLLMKQNISRRPAGAFLIPGSGLCRLQGPALNVQLQRQESSQGKLSTSGSPACEGGLEGGLVSFLPSARTLKCCGRRKEL